MDLDIMFPQIEDDMVLPEAEAFPTTAIQPPVGSRNLNSSSGAHQEQESTDSAEAPLQRKRRAPKALPVDERQELRNADLSQWNADYIANMADARAAKISHRAPFIAKRNAAFWVMGTGIGGVGAGMGSSSLQSPLAMFASETMMEALTDVKISTAGQKRGRDDQEDHDSESEARRTRIRDGDWDQLGREERMMLDDDGTMMISANDVNTPIGGSLPRLIVPRELKSVVMLRQPSKILLCHGMQAQPSDLVRDPLCMVVVLPVVLAGSLSVLALGALCHLLVPVLAQWVDAPVECPAPVLLSAVDANVLAASISLKVTMTTGYLVVAQSLMTKPLTTFSSTVPLLLLILKQQVNRNG